MPDLQGFWAAPAEGVQLGQRAAIYCRVSTADQCCDRQERDLRAFADRSGLEIVGIYKEKASGAKSDRIERKKVMAHAQAHEIDAILHRTVPMGPQHHRSRSDPASPTGLERLGSRRLGAAVRSFDAAWPDDRLGDVRTC
jgi:hypothetical protein